VMGRFLQDIQYALRMLVKSPGFTTVAVVTLALGIGANTALYSVARSVTRTQPGVARPDELVQVVGKTTAKDGGFGLLPFQDYFEYRQASDLFALAGLKFNLAKVTFRGDSAQVGIAVVTGNYFDVMGVKPLLGRAFREDETEARTDTTIAIASHVAWQQRLGGAKDIVGQTVKLNGQPFTIVGVAPEGFGQGVGPVLEFWVPTGAYDQLMPHDAGALTQRGRSFWGFVARLKPGVTLEQAQARLTPIATRLEGEYPNTNRGITARVVGDDGGDPARRYAFLFAVTAFMILGGLVLLVACANVCNLLLARAQARHREMAIRAALGASRGRLVRQLLTESVVLALLGGVVGVLFAVWTNDLLMAYWRPDVDLAINFGFEIDASALGYTAILLLMSTFFFGLVPALRLSSINLVSALKGDGGSPGGRRRWLSGGLVVAQVGTAFVLLIISGLLVRSMRAAQRSDLGFHPEKVLVAQLNLNVEGYPKSSWPQLYRDLRERVSAVPGVEKVSLAEGLPIVGWGFASFFVEGADGVGERQQTGLATVDADYFDVLGMPILEGRAIQATDDRDHPAVAVVSQSFAKHYWPGQSAVGRTIRLHELGGPQLQIVGVVRDVQFGTFNEGSARAVFASLYQNDSAGVSLLVRTPGEPQAWAPGLRGAVKDVNPEMLLLGVQSFERALAQSAFFVFQVGATLAIALGVLALLLAIVGLYGLITFGVNQKTREVGVRMALGAASDHVLWLFIRRGLVLTAGGLAAGLLVALATARLIASFLYGISALDPATFVVVPVLFGLVALLASYLPARRATRVDPMVALRCE
jgi:predicted permease